MCRGQGRYDVILGISDGAFGSNSAMVLSRGIFDGDVFSAEEIFKLRRSLIIESLLLISLCVRFICNTYKFAISAFPDVRAKFCYRLIYFSLKVIAYSLRYYKNNNFT